MPSLCLWGALFPLKGRFYFCVWDEWEVAVSVVKDVEGVLRVADFGVGAAADDGDDVEAEGFGAVVAAHVVVGHADDVLPLAVVDGLLGGEVVLVGAGLHLDNGQLAMVQRDDVHLLVPAAEVAVEDDVPLIFQIPCRHLLPRHAILLGLLPALQRPWLRRRKSNFYVCHILSDVTLFLAAKIRRITHLEKTETKKTPHF